jgi:hypothetical protein
MKKSFLAAAIAIVLGIGAPFAVAQTSSTSTASGGAGGAGGAAAGGTATGGTATNSNTTSGVSNASGGIGQGGVAGASAQGGSVGSVTTGGSQASLGDVSVILNQGSSPMGKDGMGVGVDPNTGHIVTDNTVKYSGSYKLKNTPDVGIGGPASGPCNGFSASLGFSIAGLGVGGNTSTVDENCTARETARVAAMLGRMDIANAILENLPAVQAALKAKAAREAMERPRTEVPGPTPATTSPLREDPKIQASRETAAKEQRELEQATREAALREQQNQAQEALARQATMAKVNDTLKFTDATTQRNDKTPQEIMAEEATKKLNQSGQQVAARRQEDQQPPVTISPLPPQPQISALAQPVTSIKSDAKSQMQPEGKSSERASSLSPDDRIKAAKAAMNFQ